MRLLIREAAASDIDTAELCVLLKRFPYAIFYRLVGDTIVIIGCFHGHRDPQAWRSRG